MIYNNGEWTMDMYESGFENGLAQGRREGWDAAYDRALNEWVEVSTSEPYTVVQTGERPAFVPSAPPGSGRPLVEAARASWAAFYAAARAKA